MLARSILHYEVVEQLGAGGMGVVYRAHDRQLGRDVALKVLPDGLLSDESARRRFRKEALALARLNHAHIEAVYEFGAENGLDFLVTEYVPGITLADRIARGSVAEPEIIDIGLQIVSALEEAHDQGVLHCDLKPANIMLTPKHQIKLLDFGLAKITRISEGEATQTITTQGRVAGTPPYMAPERLAGQPADQRTDIYAVGAILYELATRRRVPGGPQPHLLNPDLSDGLETVIMKCLESDPGQRFQSAAELRTALCALTQQAGESRSPLRRLVSQRPFLGLSAVSVFAAAGLSLWLGSSRPALSFAPRDWVLIADFDNQTGDPLFDSSIQAAFVISLEQSAHANVLPRERIEAVLRRMGKQPGEKVDERVAREVCLREDIRALVSGRIAKIGSRYALTASLIDARTGETARSVLEQADSPDQILDALGRVASRIRRALGESRISIGRSDRPLSRVTTPSLPALKSYSDGLQLWAKGEYDAALRLYQRAVEQDPDFAMAHADLGIAYYSHIFNNRVLGRKHYEQALARSDRVTERERLLIQANAMSDFGDFKASLGIWKIYFDAYPDDATTRYNLGTQLMHAGRYDDAIRELEQVIRVNPKGASAYINLATCSSLLGRYDEAVGRYLEAFELEPSWITSANLNHEYGFTLAQAGNATRAREIFQLAIDKPETKPKGVRSAAILDLYEGKYRDAQVRLREAIQINQTRKFLLSESRDHVFLAIALEGTGDAGGALRELDLADQALKSLGVPQPPFSARIGVLYARAGALGKAESVLRRLTKEVDPKVLSQVSELHRLTGEVALARGDQAQAAEKLLLADSEDSGPLTVESLVYAWKKLGDRQQFIAWAEKLVALAPRCFGWEIQQRWIAVHYDLAEEYAAAGDRTRAAAGLDVIARLWKGADPDLPLFQKVRRLQVDLRSR